MQAPQNGHANGHYKQTTTPANKRVLKCLDIDLADVHTVMLLSDSYGGLFTHFKRSTQLCRGKDCPAHLHNYGEPTWKGYAPILAKDPAGKVWIPFVLELTENLERDMRGIFQRGQQWEIWRLKERKKTGPVQGKLLDEEIDPSLLPPPFDVLPVVRALYHASIIDLTHKNPLPARVVVEDVPFSAFLANHSGPLPQEPDDDPGQIDDYANIIKNRKRPADKPA